jgi:Holliday junction resolvase
LEKTRAKKREEKRGRINTGGKMQSLSNKKTGTDFEREFCKLASENGFWAHMLNINQNGQPADVIISKNNLTALVDCKDCKNNKFPFSRIEENQELSMKRWIETGNEHAVFALKTDEGIYIFYFSFLQKMKNVKITGLNFNMITGYGIPFLKWLEGLNENNNQ